MPVEVRELVIKAVVNADEKPTAGKKNRESASKKNITDGLERVMEMIKNRNER